jgi:hypothetical protein
MKWSSRSSPDPGRAAAGGGPYRFSRWRRHVAIALLWVGLSTAGMSAVIPMTRDRAIREQDGLIYVSLVLAAIGGVALYHGVRNLVGYLIIDEEGVRFRPPGFGPSCPWESIDRWRIATSPKEADGTDAEREPCLVISLRDGGRRCRLPASFAYSPGFDQLVKEFRDHAGSREDIELA